MLLSAVFEIGGGDSLSLSLSRICEGGSMAAATETIDKGAREVVLSVSHLFLLLLLLSPPPLASSSVNVVTHLPGFDGPLPFYLETGYVNVNEAKDVQLFYYFIKSEREPEDDPLLVWLTGGPGCSALSGLIYEIGPLEFDVEGYTEEGLLPTLFYKSTSWTKVSSIIFLDSPVGTGFSYSTSKRGLKTSDTKSSVDVHTFLRKWYVDHPSFIANPLYVAGDSYSGFTVPVVAQYIADGNEAGYGVHLNLKGYLLGNPCTDANYDGDARIPYAHGVGFISDELYESTKSSCGGKYQNPSNAECSRCVDSVNQDLSGINTAQILEPLCSSVETPKPNIITADGRRLLEALSELPMSNTHDPLCRNYGYLLSHAWANNDTVRQALGIREGSTQTWVRCDFGLNNYTYDVLSSVNYHFSLTNRGYRALVYSGDHDMTVPFLGTQAWIRSLNFSIVDDWRPWSVEGQVAGFTRTYSNNLTFATVKGGGHTAPEYRPKECLAMTERWLSGAPL